MDEIIETSEIASDTTEFQVDSSSDALIVESSDSSETPTLVEVENIEPLVDTEVRTISSSNTNGLLSIMLDLIGDYDLVSKTVTYTGTSGYTNVQVTTETNYPWLCSCGIFALLLFCCCRFLGGVFSK